MSDVVARAKAALDSIEGGFTALPWRPINVGNIHWGVTHGDFNVPTVVYAQCSYDGYGSGSTQANAEFIAAAPDLIHELAEEVEMTADRDELSAAIERVRALHWPSPDRDPACDCYDGLQACPTVAALEVVEGD